MGIKIYDWIKNEFALLRGNLLVLILSTSILRFGGSLIAPFTSIYFRELGASPSIIGLLGSTGSAVTLLVKIPGGFIADKYGRRKLIVTLTYVHIVASAFYAFAPSWKYIAIGIIISRLLEVYNPALTAIFADSIPPEKRGAGYALRSMITGIVAVFAPTVGGLLIEEYDFVPGMRTAYCIVILLYLLAGMIRQFGLTETLENSKKIEFREIFASFKDSFLTIKDTWNKTPLGVKPIILQSVLGGFSWTLFYPFMGLYALDNIGMNTLQWGQLGTVELLLGLVTIYPLGKYIDRTSKKRAYVICYLMWIPTLILFLYSGSFEHLILFFLLKVVGDGLGGLAHQGLIADLVPRDLRGRTMALMSTLSSIGSIPAGLISGRLYETFPMYPFLLSLGLDILSGIIFVLYLKEPEVIEI